MTRPFESGNPVCECALKMPSLEARDDPESPHQMGSEKLVERTGSRCLDKVTGVVEKHYGAQARRGILLERRLEPGQHCFALRARRRRTRPPVEIAERASARSNEVQGRMIRLSHERARDRCER